MHKLDVLMKVLYRHAPLKKKVLRANHSYIYIYIYIGVVTDRDLSFNKHAASLCKKSDRKLSVLSKLSNLKSF